MTKRNNRIGNVPGNDGGKDTVQTIINHKTHHLVLGNISTIDRIRILTSNNFEISVHVLIFRISSELFFSWPTLPDLCQNHWARLIDNTNTIPTKHTVKNNFRVGNSTTYLDSLVHNEEKTWISPESIMMKVQTMRYPLDEWQIVRSFILCP